MNLILNTPTPPKIPSDDVGFLQLVCDHLRRRVLHETNPLSTTYPPDIDYIRQCANAAWASIDGPKNSIRRALLTQSWSMFLDGFPNVIEIPLSPIQAVTCIKYRDETGTWKQVPSSDYRVSAAHRWQPEIAPAPGRWWPVTQSGPEVVEVRFRAGFGDYLHDIPKPILQAILELTAHFYSERQPVVFGSPYELPFGVRHFLQSYRVFR